MIVLRGYVEYVVVLGISTSVKITRGQSAETNGCEGMEGPLGPSHWMPRSQAYDVFGLFSALYLERRTQVDVSAEATK
jgi:hypothetical protein